MSDNNAYMQFIDEMVDIARIRVTSDRIRHYGHPVRTNVPTAHLDEQEQALTALYARLSDAEKALLIRSFEDERVSALHDLAAFLEWAFNCDEMAITWRGAKLTPFATMHHDFIGRILGHTWQEVQAS